MEIREDRLRKRLTRIPLADVALVPGGASIAIRTLANGEKALRKGMGFCAFSVC